MYRLVFAFKNICPLPFQSSKGYTPTKFSGSLIPGNMHNHRSCPYYLQNFMKFGAAVSKGVALTKVWWTGIQTMDRVKIVSPLVGGDINNSVYNDKELIRIDYVIYGKVTVSTLWKIKLPAIRFQ